jgi:uncharacterized membrane protein
MKTLMPLITILCLLQFAAGCSKQAPEHRIVVPVGDRVNISLDRVNDGGVHFFTYKWDGRNINFFVRTDGTGHLQAHFDACYSCFKYKLGYVWKGKEVVCIACRIGYRLEDVIWDYIGACAPINLKSRILNGDLTINRTSLEKGKRFF